MRIRFIPKPCGGNFQAPPSKSVSHRVLILADAAEGAVRLSGLSDCDDVSATQNGLFSLRHAGAVFCGDSASTLRFLLPYAAALGKNAFFTGSRQLSARPVSLYAQLFADKAVYCGSRLPLSVSGRLNGGCFTLPAGVSSQYASGLLLAASQMSNDLQLNLSDKANSLPYIRLTLAVMRDFGMTVLEKERDGLLHLIVPGGQKPRISTYSAEGDWSNGAFWLCLGLVSGLKDGFFVTNLSSESVQGDRRIVSLLQQAGGKIELSDGVYRVNPSRLTAFRCDVSSHPDLFMLLSALSAFSCGISEFTGIAGLREKESDRLSGMEALLHAFGVRVECNTEVFRVHGGGLKRPEAALTCFSDHRLAMAAALLSLGAGFGCELTGAQCISKSWPSLWTELAAHGLCEEVEP